MDETRTHPQAIEIAQMLDAAAPAQLTPAFDEVRATAAATLRAAATSPRSTARVKLLLARREVWSMGNALCASEVLAAWASEVLVRIDHLLDQMGRIPSVAVERAEPALEALLVRSESEIRTDEASLQGWFSRSAEEAAEMTRIPPLLVRPGLEADIRDAAHHALIARGHSVSLFPTWGDASARPHLARGARGRLFLERAREAIRPGCPRACRLTGVAVLFEVATVAAAELVDSVREDALAALRSLLADLDATVRRRANEALRRLGVRGTVDLDPRMIDWMVRQLCDPADAEQRCAAAERLAGSGCFEAVSALRLSSNGDEAAPVRQAARLALASLGDTEGADDLVLTFLRRTAAEGNLENRPPLPDDLERVARLLGRMGDVRGLHALRVCRRHWTSGAFVDAWLDGMSSGIPVPEDRD